MDRRLAQHFNYRGLFMAIICILASLSTMAYFPIIELLTVMSISTPSTLYAYYNYAVFGVSMISSLGMVIAVYKGKISSGAFKGILLIVLVAMIYTIYGLFYKENNEFFVYFFLWAVPALFVGLFIPSMGNSFINIILEPLVLIMGIASISASRKYISLGISHLNTLSFGGTNYQGLSYTAALCVGFELFYVFLAPDDHRLRFFCSMLGRIIEIAVGIGAVFSVFVSGGRGGLLVLILNIFMFLMFLKIKNTYSKGANRAIQILLGLMIIVMALILIRQFSGNALVSDSFDRLVSFINRSGSNSVWNQGRNTIYSDAFHRISDNPLFGYGIFNTDVLSGEPYPHNIFLETWINAGFLYMVIWLCILVSLWKYCIRATKIDFNNGWILFLLTYSTVFLNVSGTYLWCSELWFLIGLMLSMPLMNDAEDSNT